MVPKDDEHDVLWVRIRPQKLPKQYSCIIIACIYHPPKADNGSMREYMTTSLDSILRCYPECGIILTGDFNQLRDSFLRVHYEYAQLVNVATRNGAILDKIWSIMSPVYAHPAVLSELGSFDHRMVLLVPSSYPTLDTGMIQNRVIGCMGATERMTFASALCRVRWEYMYAMDSCERHLIRQRQRSRMSGDLAEARRLRNLVDRAAPQLRRQFYLSKIDSMEESSTRDWWKHMKRRMGTSCEGKSEMQGLANKHTEGGMCSLVNSINELCVSVSEDLPRLQASHSIFDVSDPLPVQ